MDHDARQQLAALSFLANAARSRRRFLLGIVVFFLVLGVAFAVAPFVSGIPIWVGILMAVCGLGVGGLGLPGALPWGGSGIARP